MSKNKLPASFTKVTGLSKIIALAMFVMLPFGGFYLGIKYEKTLNTVKDTQIDKNKGYIIKKSSEDHSNPTIFKYELVKNTPIGENTPIYSIENANGFSFDVSDDGKFIAILNQGESMGDETFRIVSNDGMNYEDFGNFNSSQTLVPFSWTGSYYWISKGIPQDNPQGILRINATTGEVRNFQTISK